MADRDSEKSYRRKHRLLTDDVADRANIRRDVVETVLDSFYDIMAERVLNEHKFLLPGILSVSSVTTRNGIRPEPHLQLRAKVARGLKKLLQKMEEDPTLEVNRDNWKGLIRESESGGAKKMELSDFLKDDDEDF